MLLGIVVLAAGLKLTIGNAAQPHPAREALALGAGVALFLAGDAMFRRALVFGAREFRRAWPRCAMAVFALATTALGTAVAIDAQMAALLAGMVAMLLAEWHWDAGDRASAGGWST
jgi:low temperature requirement protein LtrA